MRIAFAAAVAAALFLIVASAARSNPPRPPDQPPAIDDVPKGMVAFFAGGACPSGWNVADVAAGRMLVGTTTPTDIGHTYGPPLAPDEDRVHGHVMAGVTVSIPSKNIAAADGGNNQAAAAGAQPVTGTLEAGTSGLPFVQLTACVRP